MITTGVFFIGVGVGSLLTLMIGAVWSAGEADKIVDKFGEEDES